MAAPSVTSDFVMHGARTAMAAGLSHIEEQVKGIERAIVENPGLAFDLAKTVVESACRTILTARKVPFDSDQDLPQLFKVVTKSLPMLPFAASGESEARKSLAQTLSGLHTALQGVCELRNAYGFASHGAEAPRPVMEITQALLAAQAADAIVGFLHGVHQQHMSPAHKTGLEYGDNEDFNLSVDEANDPVKIFDLTFRPSEVLFAVDQEAYRDYLADYAPDVAEAETATTTSPRGKEV